MWGDVELAQLLRVAVDGCLPPNVSATVLLTRDSEGPRLVTVCVTSWPPDFEMLSREHLLAERRRVLEGKIGQVPATFTLSERAKELARSLAVAMARHASVATEPTTGQETSDLISDVSFSERELRAERLRFSQSLKRAR